MSQTTFNNGDTHGVARAAINDNATDAESRLAELEVHHIGSVYLTATGASAGITANTYTNLLTGATIADAGITSGFTVDNTNKRLIYTGASTFDFIVIGAVSMTSSRSNVELDLKIYKNGSAVDNSLIRRKIGTGSDVGALTIQGVVALATNDYIELWGTLDAGTSDTVTIEALNLQLHHV